MDTYVRGAARSAVVAVEHATRWPDVVRVPLSRLIVAALSLTGLMAGLPAHADTPVIQVDEPTITVSESAGNAFIGVSRTGSSTAAKSIDYAVAPGTAVPGVDYTPVSGTLTWEMGDSSGRTITVPILDDGVHEPGAARTFTVFLIYEGSGGKLGNPCAAPNEPCVYNETLVTITDDDPQATVTLTAASVSALESDGSVVFTVARGGGLPESGAVTVQYATADGTATAGSDYTASSGQLSWMDGDVSDRTIVVPLLDDDFYEDPPETFTLALSQASEGLLITPTAQATATISDDETVSVIGFNPVSYPVNEADGVVELTVTRTGASGGALSVDYMTGSADAEASEDFVPTSGTLSWGDGDSESKTISVPIVNDDVQESTEDFLVTLSNLGGSGVLGAESATVTVYDDDEPGTLQFASAEVSVDEGAGTVTVSVVRLNGSSGAVSVDYQTQDATATATADYTGQAGTLQWASGETGTKDIVVPIIDDDVIDPDESFQIVLSNPSGASLGSPDTADVSITDNDDDVGGGVPTLEFELEAVSVDENAGTVSLNVTRANSVDGAVTVDYATASGTAAAGSDFTGQSGTLSWADGDGAAKTIDIPITNDDEIETGETFTVTLSAPSAPAVLGSRSVATVTIIDDDDDTSGGAPTLEFELEAVSVDENAGTVSLNVTRTSSLAGAVTVDYATASGTAAAGSDFTGQSGTLSWADGDGAAKTIDIPITNDDEIEAGAGETFTVTLSAPSAPAVLGSRSVATVTIIDDDDDTNGQVPTLEFELEAVSVDENAGTVSLNVTRANSVDGAVTVDYATASGTAAAGSDFTGQSGTLSWADGDGAAKTIDIPITNDDEIETGETFTVTLSAPSAPAVLGSRSVATVTIIDDDDDTSGGAPILALTPTSVQVMEGGGVQAVLSVARTGVSDGAVSVDYTTQNDTAASGTDYVATSGTLGWDDGDTAPQEIAVTILDDDVVEGTIAERFLVVLSNATNGAVIEVAQATVEITDDDTPTELQFEAVEVTVSEGARMAELTVLRLGSSAGSVSVDFTTQDGEATAPADYSAQSGTLLWAAGETGGLTIVVPIVDDDVVDPNESFQVVLSNPAGASLGSSAVADVTITDNDTDESTAVLEFEAETASASESGGSVTVNVTRSGPLDEAVTVDYATVNGTATAGSDFVDASGTLSWAAGDGSAKPIAITLIDDDVFEGAESFTISLVQTSGSAVIGTRSEVTVSIDEDEMGPTLSLTATAPPRAPEGGGQVILTVGRTGPATGAVTVDYATRDDTATAGSDYVAASGTLQWGDGDTAPKEIALTILDDDEFEGGMVERFLVILSNATNGAVIEVDQIAVEVVDNDAAPQLEFETTEVAVAESAGTAELTVVRMGTAEGAVTVDYAVTAGTATEGSDFTAATGTLSWADGDGAPKTIDVAILNDASFETPTQETVSVVLSAPGGGAVLGSNVEATVTIQDDDIPPDGEGLAGPDQFVVADKTTGRGEFTLEAVQLSTFTSYEWSLDGTVVGTAAELPQVRPPGEYIYFLKIVDGSGAELTDSVGIAVSREDLRDAKRLQDLDGLTENERNVAVTLDNICSRLNTRTELDEDQEDLRERCSQIILNPDTGEQVHALGEISGRQVSGQVTSALGIARTQYRNIAGRMRTLREARQAGNVSGSQGSGLSGLNLRVDGQTIPQEAVSALFDGLIGGNAGEDSGFGRWGFFLDGTIAFGDKDATDREGGFEFDTAGITAGFDYRFSDRMFGGFAIGYGQGDADFDNDDGSLDSEGWSSLFYGSYATDRYYLDGVASFGWNQHDTRRNIDYNDALGSVNRVAKGDTDGTQWFAGLEAGLNLHSGRWLFNPNVSTFYTDVSIDSFEESGAQGLDLAFDDQDAQSFTVAGGVSLSYVFTTEKFVLIPQVRLDYVVELENDGQIINVRFLHDPFAGDQANPSPIMPLRSDDPDDDFFTIALGVSGQFAGGISGFVDWQTAAGYRNMNVNTISFGLRWERLF